MADIIKAPKSDKQKEKDIGEIDYNAEDIVIYDIDKIDKIYKDIIEANEKIQILKQTSIGGSPLEVEKKSFSTMKLKNNINYNTKKKEMKMSNGEFFKGKINEEPIDTKDKKSAFVNLENGIYKWPSGEKYEGTFNKNNNFDGNGTLSKSEKEEEYTFNSVFDNGYPIKNGIFKLKKKNLEELYIQSNIIKNGNKNSTFNLILSGKTTITKKQGEKEIYRFDGEIIDGKIKGNALIHRRYKDERNVEINLTYKNNESFPNVQELEMEATDPKSKTFYYKGNYVNGLKVGDFILKDDKENINVNKKSELGKIIFNLTKIMFKTIGRESFEKIYRHNLEPIKIFNRIYKTKIQSNDRLIHVIQKNIDLEGMLYICKAEMPNLIELALNNSGIKDISPLEKANCPLLETLSLGKNQIVKIDSINRLPFPNLKLIMLGFNKIVDVSPLNQYNSANLKTLALIGNIISDISPLQNVIAPNLEQITIGCKIKDISILTKCNFPKLKQLGLKGNNIKNISPLINVNFPLLEVLFLNNNEIVDINPLKSVNFRKLLILGLDHNKIKNITPLQYLKVDKLDLLTIGHNNFRPSSSDNRDIFEFLKKKIKDIRY